MGKVKGTFADLSQMLSGKGFEYQYKAGQKSYSVSGVAKYRNPQGDVKMLKRIAKGKAAQNLPRPEGATIWLARTAQQPDTWQLFRKRSR